ncbi:hypothetical protein BM531_22645, partial [Clostridioides difficile]
DYELSDVNVTNGQKVNQETFFFTAKNPTIIAEIDSLKSQLSQYKNKKYHFLILLKIKMLLLL